MYARVVDGVVTEFFSLPDGFTIDECWSPAVVGQFVLIPDNVAVEQGWTYDGTTFAAPVSTLSLEQQAANDLATKVAAGITVTSTDHPSTLDCVMALDSVTMTQIGSVARDASTDLGLPGGLDSFTYPDINGQPRSFTAPEIISLYKAQRDLLWNLNMQAATMAHGGSPMWPPQTCTIP
jgi:hypothetical protein